MTGTSLASLSWISCSVNAAITASSGFQSHCFAEAPACRLDSVSVPQPDHSGLEISPLCLLLVQTCKKFQKGRCPTGRCPTGRCPTGRCPTGRCPTGHCPQDTAHRTLPTGRCPQDAAHRTLPTGNGFVPSAPSGIALLSCSGSEMVIGWRAPASHGGEPVQGYYLDQREKSQSVWKEVNAKSIKERVYTVSGLLEGHYYQFRAFAANIIGLSKPSEPSEAFLCEQWTMPEPGCPYDLELREVRQESLVLMWAEPLYQGQSQVTGYVVEISEGEESEDWIAVTQELITDTYLKISRLQTGHTYRLRVSAVNSAGVGRPSLPTEPVTAKTRPGTKDMEIGVDNDGFIFLSLEAPETADEGLFKWNKNYREAIDAGRARLETKQNKSILTFTAASEEDLGLYTAEMIDRPDISSSFDFTAEDLERLTELSWQIRNPLIGLRSEGWQVDVSEQGAVRLWLQTEPLSNAAELRMILNDKEISSTPVMIYIYIYTHHLKNSCTQKEVWECGGVGKEDKVPADGAVGVEVEGHQAFWTCDDRPFILVLTTVPPHTDSLGVSTKTKAGLSCVVQPPANGTGTNRITHGGHHCSLNVCIRACWVSQARKISFDRPNGLVEIVFDQLSKEDEGSYTAQMKDGRAKNQFTLVLVDEKFKQTLAKSQAKRRDWTRRAGPHFEEFLSWTVTEDCEMIMKCKVTNMSKDTKLKWFKDGLEITQAVFEPSGVSTFTVPQKAGPDRDLTDKLRPNLRCAVDARKPTDITELKRVYKEDQGRTPPNQVKGLDNSYRLVDVIAGQEGHTFLDHNDDSTGFSGSKTYAVLHLDVRTVIASDSALQVTKKEAGVYRAVVSDSRGEDDSILELVDTEFDRLMQRLSKQCALSAGPLGIQCTAAGFKLYCSLKYYLSYMKTSWYFKEKRIDQEERTKPGSSMQKVWIEIFNPTENDKGKYTLEMFDGQESHKRILDLSGQAFADALLEYQRLKQVAIAEKSDPIPEMFWLKNDRELSSSGQYHIAHDKNSSTITINSVTMEDSGNYSIFVRNTYGSETVHVTVSVYKHGEKPRADAVQM
ncbi:hypothetical protein NFI96_007768 [Prochilodus magdalenae]|nr:hypothetical protein NFI96_007768 [Prochilodus magdalenae]